MKKIVLAIILMLVSLIPSINVNAANNEQLNMYNSFYTATELDASLEQYASETDGILYVDNRICVTASTKLDTEIGQHIAIVLDNNTVVPCVIGNIEESDKLISNIIVTDNIDKIALSDIDPLYNANVIAIRVYKDNSIPLGIRISDYAQNFVGNPYVWGGESLTNGCDCSGFILALYKKYGISLPHNAEAQSNYGISVSESDLQAGDLIFYSGDGYIGHVAMYIGNGQIVHASNSAPYPDGGIKISNYNYNSIVCIKRLN